MAEYFYTSVKRLVWQDMDVSTYCIWLVCNFVRLVLRNKVGLPKNGDSVQQAVLLMSTTYAV